MAESLNDSILMKTCFWVNYGPWVGHYPEDIMAQRWDIMTQRWDIMTQEWDIMAQGWDIMAQG